MIDTHAHLLYFKNCDEIIDSMKDDGLDKIVTIGTTVQNSRESIALAEENENIFVAVGIYPEYAEETTDADLQEIERLTNSGKVVAVGEIGLDFHTEGYNKQKQIELFVRQLEIADRAKLPFCIHCRNAAKEVYEILSTHKNLLKYSGLMHCYSEGAEWIDKFLGLGLYISFSGNITFKKSDRSFLKRIPLDKILVETDAPYLSPEPVRGRENVPKNVKYVIEKLAKELEISFEEFEKITEKNAKKFYFDRKNI